MKTKPINLEPSRENTRLSRKEIISLKTKAATKRSQPEIVADWLAASFGTIAFFAVNALWFLAWIVLNMGLVTGVPIFDPFPFSLLTMLVSLEAIFLSIIVLISQNRAAKVDELRGEIDLQLDTIAEQEVTKIMQMLSQIMQHQGISIAKDSTLKEMLKPTDTQKIEEDLNQQI